MRLFLPVAGLASFTSVTAITVSHAFAQLQESLLSLPGCAQQCLSLASAETLPFRTDYVSLMSSISVCNEIQATEGAIAACIMRQCIAPTMSSVNSTEPTSTAPNSNQLITAASSSPANIPSGFMTALDFDSTKQIVDLSSYLNSCSELLRAAFGPIATNPDGLFSSSFATAPACSQPCFSRSLSGGAVSVCSSNVAGRYASFETCLVSSSCNAKESISAQSVFSSLVSSQSCMLALSQSAGRDSAASILNSISLLDLLQDSSDCSSCVASVLGVNHLSTSVFTSFCNGQTFMYPAVTNCFNTCIHGTKIPVNILGKCYSLVSGRFLLDDPVSQIGSSLMSLPPCAQNCLNNINTSNISSVCASDSFSTFSSCVLSSCSVSSDLDSGTNFNSFVRALVGNFPFYCAVLNGPMIVPSSSNTSVLTLTASSSTSIMPSEITSTLIKLQSNTSGHFQLLSSAATMTSISTMSSTVNLETKVLTTSFSSRTPSSNFLTSSTSSGTLTATTLFSTSMVN